MLGVHYLQITLVDLLYFIQIFHEHCVHVSLVSRLLVEKLMCDLGSKCCACLYFVFAFCIGSLKVVRSRGTMSRPMLLVFLLLILIITSQFEWRQPLVSDMDTNPGESQKQQQISKREEGVKEKVIVSSFNLYTLIGNRVKKL